jgi:hypothetical protein
MDARQRGERRRLVRTELHGAPVCGQRRLDETFRGAWVSLQSCCMHMHNAQGLHGPYAAGSPRVASVAQATASA